jgi:hypothetical protein
MKKAKPRFPIEAAVQMVLGALTFACYFLFVMDNWFLFLLMVVGGIAVMVDAYKGFALEKELCAHDFERIVTSEDALLRPASPAGEEQFLRVPGNTEAESDQLLRASAEAHD